MSDSALILSEQTALSAYADRDDIRELTDRLMAMHPAAGEVGPGAMRAAAQLAILLGANPLPGVNEVHIWKDNKGRNCMSLGINYWRRKGREWGGYLYQQQPRPMTSKELADYGIPAGTMAAICKGVRTADMLQFKQMGFTTNEIWDMCGRTGLGTQGANEYSKSGRPNIWTSLKRAETDMLRQLFPAEFGSIDRQVTTSAAPVVIETGEIIEAENGAHTEREQYTIEQFNEDFGLPGVVEDDAPDDIDDGDFEDAPPPPPPSTARQYSNGDMVHSNLYADYDAFLAAHNGDAPSAVGHLMNWKKKQERNGQPAATPAPLPLDDPDAAKAAADTAAGLFD